MKEIKFRAWDKKGKIMLVGQELDFVRQHITEMPDNKSFLLANKDIELMQFTGLKDKNGKEIYEGDIYVVRSLHDGDEDVWNNTEKKPIPQVVEWDERQVGFYMPGRLRYAPYDYEVIGNIYENPDFLK